MLRCGRELRTLISGAASFEDAAQRVSEALYEGLVTANLSERACVLVRCYRTRPFGELPADLQAFARRDVAPGVSLENGTRCLVLFGTAGEQPTWRSRRLSQGHQAIPLASRAALDRAPMIAELFQQLGVPIDSVISPGAALDSAERTKTYGVFHVENALGSSAVPAQEDFVVKFGVKSVVGFGGELPGDEIFATILFARVSVPREAADRFRSIALEMKSAFFVFSRDKIFDMASRQPAR
jgi:hypothetical protein